MAVVTCTTADRAEGRRIIGECDRDGYVHVIDYEGAVLRTWERNGYDDSDFYATVYDAAADEVKDVCFATTRGWTYHNGATVDATDEVRELAVVSRRALLAETARAEATASAAAITVNAGVRFRRNYNARKLGRRIEAGTLASVFWYGQNRYGYGMRAGVELEDGTRLFLDDAVIERADREVDEDAVTALALEYERNLRRNWRAREAVAA